MIRKWLWVTFAALAPLVITTETASACRTRPVSVPVPTRAEILLQQARALDAAATREDERAKSAKETAKRKRQTAAALRERARLFPEGDVADLRARADLASAEAATADAQARVHTQRAKSLRKRAAELRTEAQNGSAVDPADPFDPFDPFAPA